MENQNHHFLERWTIYFYWPSIPWRTVSHNQRVFKQWEGKALPSGYNESGHPKHAQWNMFLKNWMWPPLLPECTFQYSYIWSNSWCKPYKSILGWCDVDYEGAFLIPTDSSQSGRVRYDDMIHKKHLRLRQYGYGSIPINTIFIHF